MDQSVKIWPIPRSQLSIGARTYSRIQPKNSPKLLIVICTSQGQYEPHWFPQFEIPYRVIEPERRVASLLVLNSPISSVIEGTLGSFKAKMNLIRGLDIVPVLAGKKASRK